MTAEQLARRPDSQIDYSDVPELDADFWAAAKVVPPKAKPVVSLRLPQDVVAYFKSEDAKGYTRRMAAVLSAYVDAQKGK